MRLKNLLYKSKYIYILPLIPERFKVLFMQIIFYPFLLLP